MVVVLIGEVPRRRLSAAQTLSAEDLSSSEYISLYKESDFNV